MFRKFALALVATAALGTASLAVGTTPAEAKKGFHGGHHKGFHGGHHKGHFKHWHGHRHHGFYGYASYGGCYTKRWVPTPWGYKLRWVNLCY